MRDLCVCVGVMMVCVCAHGLCYGRTVSLL